MAAPFGDLPKSKCDTLDTELLRNAPVITARGATITRLAPQVVKDYDRSSARLETLGSARNTPG